jgi:hypothetical protein
MVTLFWRMEAGGADGSNWYFSGGSETLVRPEAFRPPLHSIFFAQNILFFTKYLISTAKALQF